MPNMPCSPAIVTVTYNSADQLEGFLGSLSPTASEIVPVLVVENLSSQAQRTEEIALRHGATFVSLEKNIGYGAAVNRAVDELPPQVDSILISNPDVLLGPELLRSLGDWLEANPCTGAVGPRILNPDGTTYPSARQLPSLRTGVGHALFARLWPNNPWSRRYRADSDYTDSPREAGWLSGSCLLVRRAAFDQIGGFDAGYFMYFEDVDLGYRLKRAGWRSDYLPSAKATHVGATSTSSNAEGMLRAHHESALRYLTKKYDLWWMGPIRLALRCGLALRLWFEISQLRKQSKS